MLKRLLHRWFVEYNPLYLLSAALVLRGVNLMSHALGALGGPLIAEVYAWALIGSAALLLRVGLRRPAIMLSLIAVVYQGDLTLHTETCAYLGLVGWLASGVWLASFVAKLFALARAMRLRVSRSALLVPSTAAAGLVVVPRLLRTMDSHGASAVAGLWTFAVLASALWTSRAIESKTKLDAWGSTVLRRSVIATWALWAALVVFHVGFWFSSRRMEPAVLVVIPPLLATRFVKRARYVACVVAATFVLVALAAPELASFTAALGVLSFALHIVTRGLARERVAPWVVGGVACVYAAAWSHGWSGGALPPHALALDGAFALAMILLAWKGRARVAIVLPIITSMHCAIQTRVITAPVTTLEWGVWSVSLGFALLLASVGASVRLQLVRTKTPNEAP